MADQGRNITMEKEEKSESESESGREKRPEPEEKEKLEGLPVETSPYVKYKDVEDYKSQGYGTEGHLDPKPGRGGGATDAPTLSGDSASAVVSNKPTH